MLYMRSQNDGIPSPPTPLVVYFFFGAGFAAGGGAAAAAFAGAFGASVCFAAPPMISRRLSPFFPCVALAYLHADYGHCLTDLLALAIPSCTELGSESRQFTGLILLYVQQLLTAWIPERVVSDVLRALENRLGVCCAQSECRAVGQLDELCKCVGSLGSAQESRVAHLLRVPCVRSDGGAKSAQSAGRRYRGGHWTVGWDGAVSRFGRVIAEFGSERRLARQLSSVAR